MSANSRGAMNKLAYSWDKRMECVARYMLLGNMRVVSEQCEVGYDTLMDWKRSDWWPEMVDQLRKQKRQKTDDSLTKLIENSLEVMKDRLENGDWFFNQKTGEIQRKPVGIRDATAITSQLLQRQLQMEDMAQKHEVQTESVQETLRLIANEFRKIKKPVEFVEVVDNAVHDEREARLQEGSGSVHEQAGSSQETGRAE